MEIEHNVFLKTELLPTAARIREAVAAHGFALQLPAEFEPAAEEAVLAVRYAEQPLEIEYYANPVDVGELRREGILRKGEARWLGERDFLVSVVARSERQLRAADALVAVITELADGRLAEAGEPPFIGPERAVRWARERPPPSPHFGE